MPCSTRAADTEHLPRSLFLQFERSGFSSAGWAALTFTKRTWTLPLGTVP